MLLRRRREASLTSLTGSVTSDSSDDRTDHPYLPAEQAPFDEAGP